MATFSPCPECGGDRKVVCKPCKGFTCRKCKGTGRANCARCNGSGRVRVSDVQLEEGGQLTMFEVGA